MAFKFVVLAALVATASAGFIGAPLGYAAAPAPLAYAAPIAKAVVAKTIDADFDPHPQYSYSYDVQDALTGDSKSQHETRDGDLVHGSYSLLESDGTRRTVDYTADSINGFNAVVRKEPAAIAVKAAVAAPVVAAAAAPVAYAQYAHAPAIAAPAHIAYSAPAAHYAYSAPLPHTKFVAPLSYASHAYIH